MLAFVNTFSSIHVSEGCLSSFGVNNAQKSFVPSIIYRKYHISHIIPCRNRLGSNTITATYRVDLPNTPPASLEGGLAVIWFRNNLRLHDNACLTLANTAEHVLPVYIFDPQIFSSNQRSDWYFARIGPHRAYFIWSSVAELNRALKYKKSSLAIRTGDSSTEFKKLLSTYLDTNKIHFIAQKLLAPEDSKIEKQVTEALLEMGILRENIHFLWDMTLYNAYDLLENFYEKSIESLTQFKEEVESLLEVPREAEQLMTLKPLPNPAPKFGDLPVLSSDLEVDRLATPNENPFPDAKAVHPFLGGEKLGLERLQEWLFQKITLQVYWRFRDEFGVRHRKDYSSKLSPWLSSGCLSPRRLYWETKRREEMLPDKPGARKVLKRGADTLIKELIRRDFYFLRTLQNSEDVFGLSHGISQPSQCDMENLKLWVNGKTGVPFVDASMRELVATGYMGYWSREATSNYLLYEMRFPDWRYGAAMFQECLIDFDASQNWFNWARISKAVNSSSERLLSVDISIEKDKEGCFIRRWCPELLYIPPSDVHTPHLLSEKELARYEVVLGKDYPRVCVNDGDGVE